MLLDPPEFDDAPSTCQHLNTEVRRRPIAGGATTVQRQCVTCGQAVGGAISKKTLTPAELAALAEWDAALVELTHQRWVSAHTVAIAEAARKSKEWWAWYDEYLQSDLWREKRRRVLARDHYICQGCLDKEASHVHHLTYEHVGDELLFELTSLCVPCHERAHQPSRRGAPPPKTP